MSQVLILFIITYNTVIPESDSDEDFVKLPSKKRGKRKKRAASPVHPPSVSRETRNPAPHIKSGKLSTCINILANVYQKTSWFTQLTVCCSRLMNLLEQPTRTRGVI